MTAIRYAARPDEAAEKEPRAPIKAVATALWVDFETDRDVIASVLPRPLSAGREPLVHLSIGKVEMESGAAFGIGNITVRAVHHDLPGEYGLAMPMGSEAAVIGGRETWGEPKKLADCEIERTGDDVVATITRRGITYAELRGRVVETLAIPPPRETLDFYFKFLIAPDGKGFDQDPALVHCRRTYHISRWERVEGEVVLRDSPFDPIADIPVGRIVSFHYVEFESQQVGEIVERIPGEWIAPFVHQRYDHFSWSR
jgi:acetoacetate decarboxylase